MITGNQIQTTIIIRLIVRVVLRPIVIIIQLFVHRLRAVVVIEAEVHRLHHRVHLLVAEGAEVREAAVRREAEDNNYRQAGLIVKRNYNFNK